MPGRNQGPSAATSQIDEDVNDREAGEKDTDEDGTKEAYAGKEAVCGEEEEQGRG